jgi:hypothetical protein
MSNLVYLFILAAVIVALIILRMPKRPSAPAAFPYRSKAFLLSPAERSFMGVLDQVLSNTGYRVFAKVRLPDIVEVDNGLQRSAWQSAFNSISRKHVDFVVCRSDDMAIVGAIELDDGSHEKGKRKDRDIVVDKILEAAEISLLRVKAAPAYAPNEIRNLLANEMKLNIEGVVLGQSSGPFPVLDSGDQGSEEPVVTPSGTDPFVKPSCPKCGSPLVPRVANKGKYQGQKFWGCSQFPNCKYVAKRS